MRVGGGESGGVFQACAVIEPSSAIFIADVIVALCCGETSPQAATWPAFAVIIDEGGQSYGSYLTECTHRLLQELSSRPFNVQELACAVLVEHATVCFPSMMLCFAPAPQPLVDVQVPELI